MHLNVSNLCLCLGQIFVFDKLPSTQLVHYHQLLNLYISAEIKVKSIKREVKGISWIFL